MIKNILITGKPGCGKSTLIQKLIKNRNVGGILTPEIRKSGIRYGFEIIDLKTGKKGLLSSVDTKGPKIGKYGVNLIDIENVGVEAIRSAIENSDFIIIDELGKMEILSEKFRDVVLKALDSDKPVIATITRAKDPFIDRVKKRDDVKLFYLERGDFERILKEIETTINRIF